ncbi:hypothetical protein PTSG_05347 [Salpingoeca rosetta]|uniref:K Homology domain-containing protein n=1 Tax=Salpingoeca rosetta (strain ATCC 50818 / BSB-021) TaxID=946362 RepID=F2UA63_SALR5|nr:uncharacterized protein PTSG_05347 [Salpingoeca rosetta]EGD73638.1 hypothetical protein PTSG_05347 [Salpingoeca rosetta]|eukprot:XP_004993919.1 hypothetical protein PTSG_05347 [Salpingoeca rosetta]
MDDDATAHVKRPRILMIGRYMYRTNLPPLDERVAPYMEDDHLGMDAEEDVAVETLESGVLRCEIDVPRALHGLVIGRGGAKISGIEKDTQTRIKAPGKRSKKTTFVLEADSMENLDSARTRLQLAMDDAMKKCAPTHFVSIPLTSPQLTEALDTFSQTVMQACGNSPGLTKELFIDKASFHLTLGVMKLFTEADIERAKELLEGIRRDCGELLPTTDRTITIRGLDIMQPAPEQAHVLYARASLGASDALQAFADAVAARYHQAGLFDEPEVKLHATLINTKFRRAVTAGRRPKRVAFDASKILQQLGSHEFGTCALEEVHLSRMSRRDGEYYIPEHVVDVSCADATATPAVDAEAMATAATAEVAETESGDTDVAVERGESSAALQQRQREGDDALRQRSGESVNWDDEPGCG